MKSSLGTVLRRQRFKLVEFKRRPAGSGRLAGFVLDSSPELVLVHYFDFATFTLNGYSVIRCADVSAFRCFGRQAYWQRRAVAHFKVQPVAPVGVSIGSFEELLGCRALEKRFVAVYRERIASNVCLIGPVTGVTGRQLTMEDLNANAEWTGPRRIRFADMTRVDFDDGYIRALETTAPARHARS